MEAGIFGKYPGVCTNNNDPENLGRIKVRVPALFALDELEEWAWPCLAPGDTKLPKRGDGVWVEFAGGDENCPIWSGMWYSRKTRPNTEFKERT